jgi:hypothetical protein
MIMPIWQQFLAAAARIKVNDDFKKPIPTPCEPIILRTFRAKRNRMVSRTLHPVAAVLTGTSFFIALAGGECAPTTDQLPAPQLTVSFADHIQPIFNTHCIRCHVNGGFANQSGIPLKLVEGSSYDLLVNQASAQQSDLTLVLPGDAENSLLYLKISQPTPPVGRRMPWDSGRIGSTVVSEEEIELIRTWIDEGAYRN